MKSFSVFFAKLLSVVFHPIFVPTYAYLLYSYRFLPMFSFLSFALVFLFTAIIPSFSIVVLYKLKMVSSLTLEDAKDRKYPYLITLISYQILIFLLGRFGDYFFYYICLAMLCLALVTCINLFWKISAHMTAFGVMIVMIMSQAYIENQNPYELFVVSFFLAGLIAYARIKLKSHTLLQTLVGFLLCFFVLFIFILIL